MINVWNTWIYQEAKFPLQRLKPSNNDFDKMKCDMLLIVMGCLTYASWF